MRLTVKLGLALAALMGAVYLFAFPARTYLDQKHDIAVDERTISVLSAEDSRLASQRSALQNDATIEQIAREQYGLVMPGQQAFMVLPSPQAHVRSTPKPAERQHWYSPLEFWHWL